MKKYVKFLALFLSLITLLFSSLTVFADAPNYSKAISNIGKKLSSDKFSGASVYAARVAGVKINSPSLEMYAKSSAKSHDFKYVAEAIINLSAAGKDVRNINGVDLFKKLDTLSVSALAGADSVKKAEISAYALLALNAVNSDGENISRTALCDTLVSYLSGAQTENANITALCAAALTAENAALLPAGASDLLKNIINDEQSKSTSVSLSIIALVSSNQAETSEARSELYNCIMRYKTDSGSISLTKDSGHDEKSSQLAALALFSLDKEISPLIQDNLPQLKFQSTFSVYLALAFLTLGFILILIGVIISAKNHKQKV